LRNAAAMAAEVAASPAAVDIRIPAVVEAVSPAEDTRIRAVDTPTPGAMKAGAADEAIPTVAPP